MLFNPRPLWVAALVTLSIACSAPEVAPREEESIRSIDYELFPTTRQLEAADFARLTELNADGTIRFASTPAKLKDLSVGEVLLSGITPKTPAGLLRVVLAIDTDDSGALVLRTAAAPLQLAFKKLHARVADVAAPFGEGLPFTPAVSSAVSVESFGLGGDLGDHQDYQVIVFDGDDNLSTKNDQVVIDAGLGGGFEFDLSIDVDWGAVDRLPQVVTECITSIANIVEGDLPTCSVEELMPELKLSLEVSPYLDAEVKISGAASVGFSESFDVGTIVLPPITLGPLVFLPSADIVATIEGSASARFSADAHANIKVTTKVVLSSKAKNSEIIPFEVEEVDADAETPEIDLYAEARVKPGVRFTLALYGVIGPYATVSAVAALRANPLQNPCWEFGVGLETQLGVVVKTPSLPVIGSVTFLDWNTGALSLFDKTLASGTCDVTEEGESMPPGGGPTATTLQKPPFTPWAKMLGAPADAIDLESVLAYPTGFPFLTPSIDGRYVAGGGGAQTLLKLDDKGAASWTSQLITPFDMALRSLGSVASADAGLVTLFRPGDSSAFVLVKHSQSGVLERALAFTLPDDCRATPQALARDGGAGFVVVGECPTLKSAWLVHLDAGLTVLRARKLSDENPETIRLTPTALTRSGDDLVVVGDLIRTGEAAGSLAFIVRLNDMDDPQLSAAFACPERLSLYPSAVIPSSAGSLTMVGDASGKGYVARIKVDGSLGFARFPNLGGGIASGFAPNAVVELPTTGLVIAATVDGVGDSGTDLILVGLDGNGRVQWGREYVLHGEAGIRSVGWPSARLTDDGGILVSATAGREGESTGELLGMKVFARDGTLADGPLVTSTEVVPDEEQFAVEPRPLTTTVESIAVTVRDFEGTEKLRR